MPAFHSRQPAEELAQTHYGSHVTLQFHVSTSRIDIMNVFRKTETFADMPRKTTAAARAKLAGLAFASPAPGACVVVFIRFATTTDSLLGE